ncbi:hypothetical protein ACJX0J_016777, partial [Zea mays]
NTKPWGALSIWFFIDLFMVATSKILLNVIIDCQVLSPVPRVIYEHKAESLKRKNSIFLQKYHLGCNVGRWGLLLHFCNMT